MRNLFNDVNENISDNITPALDNKVDISSIGIANGVAGLDSNGLIPSSQLPSYVDDVLEYSTSSSFPATGSTGKIYVALDTNKTYRWGGTEYVEISESLALGTTSSTAYRGDLGDQLNTKVGSAALTTTAQDVSGAVNELNSALSDKANKQTQLSAFYGTCTTDAATQAKTATITDSDGNFSLRAGVNIFIKFTNTNSFSVTADTPITLNVNNTGAKQIRGAATAVLTGTNTTFYGRSNYINQYVYDGTYWVWAGSSTDNNTTYSAMSTSELTTGTATTARSVRADYLKTGINSLIDTKIGGLDVASVGGSGKYISEISETDGKISATASNMPTIPDQLSDLTDDSTHRLVTDTEKTTWNNKANASDIPTTLSQLSDDSTHRVVTDTEKTTWNGKSNFSGSYNDLSNKPTIPAAVAVKGNAESTYRTGNVNLTPANIGACADNDTRLSNSRPASDVYAWAKASSKPSYSWSEISSKPQKFELVASFENTTVKEGYANISKSVTLANYDILFVVGGAADGQLRVYNAVPTAVALNRTIQNNIYIDKRYYFNIYCTSTTVQLKYISDANLYLTRYIWVYGLKN